MPRATHPTGDPRRPRDPAAHWNRTYARSGSTGVGWYRPHLTIFLDLIRRARIPRAARILDVGGGASTLVDDLIEAGYENLSVLDVSRPAMDQARARLGRRAAAVEWIEADILVRSDRETHRTPSGMTQDHTYCLFRFERTDSGR